MKPPLCFFETFLRKLLPVSNKKRTFAPKLLYKAVLVNDFHDNNMEQLGWKNKEVLRGEKWLDSCFWYYSSLNYG